VRRRFAWYGRKYFSRLICKAFTQHWPHWVSNNSRKMATTTTVSRRLFEEAAIIHNAIVSGQESSQVHNLFSSYIELYTCVYSSCRADNDINGSNMYKLVNELASTHILPKGPGRDIFVKYWGHVFSYVNRFYVKRLSLLPVEEAMVESMDNSVARTHHLRRLFRRWSLNERLLGPSYADGGAAKKRACEWWAQNIETLKKRRRTQKPLQ